LAETRRAPPGFPLDWAIVETWQKAGIPLPAVLKGIDRAFESYARSRRATGGRQLKSLAYCVDAVLDAAEEERKRPRAPGQALQRSRALKNHFRGRNFGHFSAGIWSGFSTAESTVRATQQELASCLDETGSRLAEMLPLIDVPGVLDLEDLERRLTVLEEKMAAALTSNAPEEFMVEVSP